jgi:hypothetical protein
MKRLIFGILIITCTISIKAQNIYVSTQGNDGNPGTKAQPVLTFNRAQQLARKQPRTANTEVIFAKGTYYLPDTEIFTSADNKAQGYHVTYKSETEGGAVLSGGKRLSLKWKPYKDGIFVATTPANIKIDQLFINGQRQRMARYPNAIPDKIIYDTWDASPRIKNDSINDPLNTQRIARWKNPKGGFLHAMHEYLWGDMHYLIKGKNADGSLITKGGWQNNRPSKIHTAYRFVENIFEELDAPGEWFYNAARHLLYFMPPKGTDLNHAKVETVSLKHLIEWNGSKNDPVKSVHLQGFIFRQAARTFMENKEPLLRSDWTIYRGGALLFHGAEECTIRDCEFDQLGGNAILVNGYNKHITIEGCYIHHCGASGIAFVGDTAAVRVPQTFTHLVPFDRMDLTPGTRSTEYPQNCLVQNCLITMTGRDEKQTAGIQISMSYGIHISHCSIYDMPRAGINIGEGTFGGNVIEHCDIFNTVLETGDHGSFNSWGRDRFWKSDPTETIAEVTRHKDLPTLDMLAPNIIRNNRWRCDHGWDIDLDDGSSNYRIYNNLMLHGGLKLREGYNRVAKNNIIIGSSLHPHCWFPNSNDTIEHNIFTRPYQPAVMQRCIATDGKWGALIDYNMFACDAKAMTRFAINGCDSNSVFGNPEFVNPVIGDYRVKDNSMALKIGFVNFPMDDFGVRKPSLRAIAKTPALPDIDFNITASGLAIEKPVHTWLDVVLREPAGEEMSAFGVGFDDGGILLTIVTPNTAAAQFGFRSGDLLQGVDGTRIKTIKQLSDYFSSNAPKDKTYTFTIIRNQAPCIIKIKGYKINTIK